MSPPDKGAIESLNSQTMRVEVGPDGVFREVAESGDGEVSGGSDG